MRSVLFIDDSSEQRNLYDIFFRKTGRFQEWHFAELGAKALYLLTGDSKWLEGAVVTGKTEIIAPDLIILELNMPRMNGFEFLHELKAYWEADDEYHQSRFTHRPKIILATGSASPSDKEKGFKIGIVNDFMSKPFDIKKAHLLADRYGQPV